MRSWAILKANAVFQLKQPVELLTMLEMFLVSHTLLQKPYLIKSTIKGIANGGKLRLMTVSLLSTVFGAARTFFLSVCDCVEARILFLNMLLERELPHVLTTLEIDIYKKRSL